MNKYFFTCYDFQVVAGAIGQLPDGHCLRQEGRGYSLCSCYSADWEALAKLRQEIGLAGVTVTSIRRDRPVSVGLTFNYHWIEGVEITTPRRMWQWK